MLQILEHRRLLAEGEGGDLPAFRQFLGAFVPAFCRASNNMLDLQVRGSGAWLRRCMCCKLWPAWTAGRGHSGVTGLACYC